jgi:hypothetical protein
VYLSRLPRWLPFAVALGLAVFGALVHGPAGAVALGLVALFLAWLAYLSWPALTPPARVLRAVATLAVVGAAVAVY